MKSIKTALIASAFLAGGMLTAVAQTSTTPSAGVSISAATHCKDAQGNAKLKTAASGGAAGTSSTSGSASGSGSAASGMPSGTASGTSGSTTAAANLAPCPN